MLHVTSPDIHIIFSEVLNITPLCRFSSYSLDYRTQLKVYPNVIHVQAPDWWPILLQEFHIFLITHFRVLSDLTKSLLYCFPGQHVNMQR